MHKIISLNLHLLTADKQLRPHLTLIKEVARSVIGTTKKILPFKESVDILVYRYHSMGSDPAIGAYSPTKNVIWIFTDPDHKYYKKLMRTQLLFALSSKLYHACRLQNLGTNKTLIESLINEGLMAWFSKEAFGILPKFYTQFNSKDLATLLKRAKKEFNNSTDSSDNWFYGNKSKRIPMYAGYAVGYYLVSDSVQKFGVQNLVTTKAGQILK